MGGGRTGGDTRVKAWVLKRGWRIGIQGLAPASMCTKGKHSGQGQVYVAADLVAGHGADLS